MEAKVKAALEQVRPFLQRDGGDIELIEITPENIVKVALKGQCVGCPGAMMTIKGVVETIVKEAVPEVVAVESI